MEQIDKEIMDEPLRVRKFVRFQVVRPSFTLSPGRVFALL